ncbi:signal recognition particle protein [Ectothiorhodospira lacustris]|uniref:signal recognition particle protein n=1 Tax=Ectothiorhodospira lacustris TaxID=2899127 RepID=UPI001EE7D085|nr:signal recognition particle protein [Ectothiorhodospira lacustris]MCG5499407.1 signal recognition particle protein [Ectothiorhodospira lacustris]MCG5511288.1 signal recognition particle protein [Ectothiorhodospira lacustris]MCG5523016.1 signal recognition particle protein [Ectothiorhodospira lacustris]
MFDSLSERLQGTIKRLRGQARLTEENIQDTIREVRKALLEADVALPVVREFIARVKERAVGQEVLASLTPGQALVKVVNDELIKVMGEANDGLKLNVQPPAVILMAGLQGAGKTTTVAKLARWLKERQDKKVMVASCDVYRPAAIRQLQTLAGEVGVNFFPSEAGQAPLDIAAAALEQARRQHQDVLIVDTAGRLHIDGEMMDEIRRLHERLNPAETLFVVDSMTGQDAANTAKAFNDALPLTGVVLTKADGDARGGAALSVRHITGKPIKFLGMGEKTAALEPFHPDRLASRILGMGDVLSLVEEASRQVDQDKAEKLARKIKKGKTFDLEDLRDQLGQMSKMGGMSSLLEKLPGAGDLPDAIKNKSHDKDLQRMVAIINSMTPKERRNPDIIKGSRKRRIAAGSGTQVQDVNRLLKQHLQMSKMVKQFSKGGMSKMMKSLKGRMPGGRLPF